METTETKKRKNSNARKQMAEFIVEGYSNGSTLTELAKLYGCSASTVSNILTDHGIKARRRGPNNVKEKDNKNGNIEQVVQPNTL
jgi:DNA invertase Pin-like site-specific DNA recombinase